MSKNLEFFWKAVITFGLVFDISFALFPSASTGRISLLILLSLYWRALCEIKILKKFSIIGFVSLMFFAYALVATVLNGIEDTILLSRAFWFFVYAIVAAILYSRMCEEDLGKMLIYFLGAVLLQATFVYWSAISSDFRFLVSSHLMNSGNIEFSEAVRFSGISNSGGALLSVQLSVGAITAYALFKRAASNIARLGFFGAIIYIALSTILVGRTGLYVCLLMLVILFFGERKMLTSYIFAIIILYVTNIAISGIQPDEIDYSSDQFQFSRTILWALDIFISGESSSLQDLKNSPVREISVLEFLFGSGRVFDEYIGNYSGSDSGYLQTIFAAGFPIAILFYFSIVHFGVTSLMRTGRENRVVALFLLIFVFTLELKEPFIHKYTIAFFSIVFWHLASCRLKRSN